MPRLSKKQPVPEISKTGIEALQAMLGSNFKSLYKWSGGFWAVTPRPYTMGACRPEIYFPTCTIIALIKRNVVDVSASHGSGRFTWPVEVRLNHLSYEVLKCRQ